jgi:hypothetical protein
MPSLNDTRQQPEIIAVVLPDGTPDSPSALQDFVATGTMLLVRHPDGRMALEPARQAAAWAGQVGAKRTVSKSRPILDPISREVMGYEMEVVDHSLVSA